MTWVLLDRNCADPLRLSCYNEFLHALPSEYDPTTGMNDICILKLDDDLSFNSNVGAIDLDFDGSNGNVGTQCHIVGFGKEVNSF